MAHYDYRCKSCGYTFELNVSIADRDNPLAKPCPDCGVDASTWTNPEPTGQVMDLSEFPIERLAAAPGVSYTYGGAKTPESFKDVLRNIKSKHRHSTINV